jgi:hypothetical protein
MTPKEKDKRFAVKTRAAGFTGRIWVNAKKFLIILKKVSACHQCDDKKAGEHNPQNEEELSVILHARSLFRIKFSARYKCAVFRDGQIHTGNCLYGIKGFISRWCAGIFNFAFYRLAHVSYFPK